MTCEFLHNGVCQITQQLVNSKISTGTPPKSACEACMKSKNPKAVNYVTINRAMSWCRRYQCNKLTELIQQNNEEYYKQTGTNIYETLIRGNGCGTELHKIYTSMGFSITPTCSCVKIINLMNEWGPDVCRQNVDQIVNMTKQSAVLHSWLGKIAATLTPSVLIKKLTLQAIKNYERKISES